MKGDRSWMYGPRYMNKRNNPVFVKGVEGFFYYAFSIQENISNGDRIKCPCAKCGCTRWLDMETIGQHLMKSGFRLFYETWYMHGESEGVEHSQTEQLQTVVEDKRLQDMLNKAKTAVTKAYGENMQELKEHSVPRPYEWIPTTSRPRLVDHWCNDTFASRSQRNRINRAVTESSGATTVSVNMLVHKQRFKKEHQRKPRWSDELFGPTHTSKKTWQFISAKARKAQEDYDNAMVLKHGEDRSRWPSFDKEVWYSLAIDDQNAHDDNYGLDALGQTRAMYCDDGSSNTPSRSSGSYSSVPAAPCLRQEDIDAISSQVLSSIMPQITASIMPQITSTITKQISRAFRAAQGGSSSNHASMHDSQDDNEDDGGDDGKDH